MARPKKLFSEDLAMRAQADLDTLDPKKVAGKLKAIIAATKHPIETVADITGVTFQTICRWAAAYEGFGLQGLYPRPKKPKPSKLQPKQKAKVLSWVDTGKTSKGKAIHWTLDSLRQAIIDEFGVTLGRNTIWVWLRKEGFKLKVPRPRHYESDVKAQADFKKNSKPKQKSVPAR